MAADAGQSLATINKLSTRSVSEFLNIGNERLLVLFKEIGGQGARCFRRTKSLGEHTGQKSRFAMEFTYTSQYRGVKVDAAQRLAEQSSALPVLENRLDNGNGVGPAWS